MRIAMLSWESLHSVRAGGVAVHVTELAAALQRHGHDVHVITRRAPGQDNYAYVDDVHYHMVDMSDGSDFVHEVHNMNEGMIDRFLHLTDFVGGFDIVHGHDWLTCEAMVQIKERWGLRGVLTMHSTEFGRNGNVWHDEGEPRRKSELERYGTYCANAVIAVSFHLRDELMHLYQCPDWKAHVVYNGVNYHEFDGFVDPGEVKQRYGVGPLNPMVLFVGRATLQKGPDLLLEAVPKVLATHPEAQFVLAAAGEMVPHLQYRAGELGVQEAVRFVGQVPRGEFVNLMRACDIVAVPSRNEPFGIVVLEGWAAGKPVVVTDRGGPDEFVDHDGNGLKVYAEPESIAWGLGSLMADWDHARWLGENGRKTVEARFGWDLIADYTLGVYEHALNT
jgi:glycosyltransferase involved in cell wall biosynthesis